MLVEFGGEQKMCIWNSDGVLAMVKMRDSRSAAPVLLVFIMSLE